MKDIRATLTDIRQLNLRHVFLPVTLASLLTLSLLGCTHVNYVGDQFSPTAQIDIFYSEDQIDRSYDLIGHGLGSGFWVKNSRIQNKLIEEAKRKGADALLVTGLGKSNVLIGNGFSTDEKQLNVVFLKYKGEG